MNNMEQMMQLLQVMQVMQAVNNATAAQPQPQAKQDGFPITGSIVQFENSECKIGDVDLHSVPNDVVWTEDHTAKGVPYIRSKYEYSAIAHVGEHGRIWGTDVKCTGNVHQVVKGTNSSFKDRLAKLKGETAAAEETDDSPL